MPLIQLGNPEARRWITFQGFHTDVQRDYEYRMKLENFLIEKRLEKFAEETVKVVGQWFHGLNQASVSGKG